MKKIILAMGLILCTLWAWAQPKTVSKIYATVYSKDFPLAKKTIMTAVRDSTTARIINFQDDSKSSNTARQLKIIMLLEEKDVTKIDKVVEKLGYVENKNLQTIDNTIELQKLTLELDFLKKRLDTYQKEIEKTSRDTETYREYFQRMREIEDAIFGLEKAITDRNNEVLSFYYELAIIEDVPRTSSGSDYQVTFVNMPGVEYRYLNIENPKASLTAETYQGVGLKYMFTKGKSYVALGAYRRVSSDQVADSTQVRELFYYSFGQDFYPSHFGRGTRKFLNLYTGYNVGGMFATGDKRSFHSFYLIPHIGLELIKTRYFILDTNVGYLVPFKENRNLRGLIISGAFNFLF